MYPGASVFFARNLRAARSMLSLTGWLGRWVSRMTLHNLG